MNLWEHAAAARDEAMATVESHSAPWAAVAMDALRDVARSSRWVTSEAVFACLDSRGIPRPVEPRAMGPVMVRGVKEGLIVRDRYERSTDPKHHRDIQTVYRSIVTQTSERAPSGSRGALSAAGVDGHPGGLPVGRRLPARTR